MLSDALPSTGTESALVQAEGAATAEVGGAAEEEGGSPSVPGIGSRGIGNGYRVRAGPRDHDARVRNQVLPIDYR